MSGHSKWHSIRHKKAAVDAKRGKIFTKLIKEITVAARIGGGDIEANPRLRTAVQAAKAANMPFGNINRAIKKGTGELPGQSYEAAVYEGYGTGGVAVFVEALTDNKNRTVADVRHIFSKHGGSLGENGSVQWMFEKKGYLCVDARGVCEDELFDVALEGGAEDMSQEGDTFSIYSPVADFEKVKSCLEESGIPIVSSELTMVPQNEVPLAGRKAEQMLKLMEALEEHEDVQQVYANFDIDEKEMEVLTS